MITQFPTSFGLPSQTTFKRALRDETLDDLENDDEYINRASRFLQSLGEKESDVDDLYEYFRDADWNLASGANRAFNELPNFTDQQKQDYRYLKQRFDKADTGSMSQYLSAARDIGIDIVTDPMSILSAMFIPLTGGASVATRAALGEATRMGLKQVGKGFAQSKPLLAVAKKEKIEPVQKGAALVKTKLARKQALQKYYKDQVKYYGTLGATEGSVWAGMDEYLRQERDDVDGIDLRYGMDYSDIGLSAAMGGILGGAFGAVPTKLGQKFSPEVRNSLHKFADETQLDESDLIFKANRAKDIFIANTIGKPTTRLMTISKYSPTLQKLLTTFRYDTYKGIEDIDLEAVRKGDEPITRSYKETADDYEGRYMVAYEDAVRPLLKGKKLTKKDEQILTELMRSKEAQDIFEEQIVDADRIKLVKELFPNASIDHIKTYAAVRNLSNRVLGDGQKVGIYRQALKAGPNAWFPRRWKWSVVDEDRDELAKIMVDSNAVVVDDNIALELIDESNRENLSNLISLENNIVDLIDNTKNKNYEDIIQIARSYNIDIPKEGDSELAAVTFGKQLTEARNAKRELINTIPSSRRLTDEKYKVANNVIDEMLGKKDLLHQIDGDTLGTILPSSFSPRNLFMLDDKDIAKFIDDDFDLLMRDYFSSSARLYARKQLFGANVDEFKERFIDDIRDELKAAGGSLKGKDAEELVKIYEYATGLNQQGFNSNVANTLSDYSKLSQQLAHLPLATLSSFTEILIPLTRVDADIYAKGVGKAFKNASTSFYDNTKKLLQDDHNLGREEAHREMHRVMLGLEQAIAQRIDSLAGEGVQSPLARKIQNVFFKGNLLSQWTRTVQLAAFTMGKDMITRNLRTIKNLEAKGIKNLTKGEKRKLDDATLQLYDLNVDINRGKTWIDRGESKYHKISEDRFTGMKKWDDFYENHIMKGAARFANEVILDPSKAAVTRPHAQQHPVGTILFQFLGYPTAFTNTVLKNYYTQIKRNPVTGTAKVGSVALLMTGVAAGLNAIRSNGESLEKEPNEIILDSVSRWGGLGFGEYIQNIRKNQEIGGGTLGSVAKGISGPIVGDVVDSILYRKGPNEFLMTNMPGYSALDMASSGIKAVTGDETDIKGNLKSFAREQDYIIDVGLGLRKPREPINPYTKGNKFYRDARKEIYGYAEGGTVDEEIKGISKNPSTKIDKMTGVPYSEQAGDIIEDREEFVTGGFAKLAKETLSSILNLSSKEIDEDPRLNYTNKLFLNQKDIEEDPLDDFTGLTIEQGPEEQLRIRNLVLDDSEFKDDYVHIRNPEADERTLMPRVTPMEYKEDEIGSNLYNYKGTPYNEVTSNDVLLRASRSLDYEGDIPNAPFLLVYDDKFLNVFQNLETRKALNSIRKDYEKELEQIKQIDNLDTKYPEFDSAYFAQKILSKYNDKFSSILLNEGYDVIGYFPKSQTNLSKELTDIQGSYIIDKILTAKGTEDKSKSVKDALGRYSPEELQELLSSESMSRARRDKEIKDTYETIERVNPATNQTFKQRIKLPEEIKAEYERDKDIPLEVFKREETGYEDLVGPTDPEIDDPVERMAEPVYKITDGIRRKRSYILLNPEAQLINLHKTAKPSQKEIDFVNARPTQEKIDFINEGNVTNLPVKAITNILDNEKTFHMVSTASSATDMGQIISYHPLTNKFLRDVRNSIDIGSDLPIEEFTAESFNVAEASISPSGMIRMDLEGPYGIINRIKTGRMKTKFKALLEEGKYSPEDADTSYFNIGNTGNPKEDYKEVIDFIIFHERAHNRIKRKPNEDPYDYEKRINQVAIAKLEQQATYENLVDLLNKQSKTEDVKYVRMDTFGGQEVPVLYDDVYNKEQVVNQIKRGRNLDEEVLEPSKLWFHPLDNNILNPLARHWRLLNVNDKDILNSLEPDVIRDHIKSLEKIKLHNHEANKNRFVKDVYQRLGDEGQVEEEIELGKGKLGLADVAEELDRNLKMEKRYDDLVPEKSAILYKRGRTWTRTPPPAMETGLTPQTNPQVIRAPSKKQAKVAVLKNTEGLNEEEINLISDAWLYKETGGAAGDYQPLKKYVENNLPFSQGLGTQAFIQDLINEFSAVPNVRGKLARALRRKTKVKPIGNIPYKDFNQGSLVKVLRTKKINGGLLNRLKRKVV